ncbi:MAG: hypothetical protein AAF579_10235 [Cyanobacteria bacterium P01_C01_bin.118]
MTNQSENNIIALGNLDALSFDQFRRDPSRDIVCVAPVRSMVHREEEVTLVRRVRKVEEVDASPACPVSATQITKVYQAEDVIAQTQVGI